MQEVAPRAIGLRPEIQVDRLLTGLRAHPEPAGQLLEVGGERRHRGVGRGLAHDLAHDQPVAHELQWHVRTHGEARTHSLVELRERRHGPAAHGREGLGEADGFDQVRRGGIESFLAEEGGDLGHPRNGERFCARPQMGVPARGLDARAVTRLGGQAVERPWHPGGRGLHGLGQGAKGPIVVCGGRQLLEGGRVPRPAYDGDIGEALLGRFADAASHRGLALERQALPFRQCVADGGHRFRDGGEQVAGIASRLDQAIPEAFSVFLTRGLRELVEGIVADVVDGRGVGGVLALPCLAVVGFGRIGGLRGFGHPSLEGHFRNGELRPGREVDEPGGDAVLQRPAQSHPFRAELGHRVERRDAWFVGRVDEERDRGPHPRIRDQIDQVRGVRRSFHEQGVRLQPLELGEHAPRRTGAVVADAEDRRHRCAAVAIRPPRGRPCKARANRRRVPSSRSPGTHATRRRPGRDRG